MAIYFWIIQQLKHLNIQVNYIKNKFQYINLKHKWVSSFTWLSETWQENELRKESLSIERVVVLASFGG